MGSDERSRARAVTLFELRDVLRHALSEAGIGLHDCDGPGRLGGGCCLTICPARGGTNSPGVIVGWTCADTLSGGGVDGDRYDAYQTVQDTMNEALWAILDTLGFPVEPFGHHGVPLVVGPPPPPEPTTPRPWDVNDLGGPPRVVDEPLFGEPFPAVETDDGRLGRLCATCGHFCERLHFPQARTSSGVCCSCWDGRTLICDDEHPTGRWVDAGRCDETHNRGHLDR